MELTDHKNLLQTVFDAASNGIAVMRSVYEDGKVVDFSILLFNDYTLNWIGDTDYKGKRYGDLFPMVRQTGILERFIEVAETGISTNFERWYEGEGMKHWFRFTAVKQDDLLVVTTEDITESKRAELLINDALDTVERQKRLYDSITSNTPDLVYVFDLNYRFVYANKALLDMWGKSEAEAIGRNLLENGYEPWHAEMHEREIDEVVAGKKSIRGTVSFPHTELGIRIYDYIFAPVFNEMGEVEAIAGTSRDISEIKKAEVALIESEQYSRQLTETVPAIIWITEPDGSCSYLNNLWYEYTGQTQEEATGFGWLDATHPDDKETAGKVFIDANAAHKPFSLLYRLRTKSGEYRWCKDSGSPKFAKDGAFEGYIGTVVDVHEEKLAEDKMRRSEEQYRKLFNSIDAGFCTIDVLFDETGKPYNYRFLEINQAFEQQTGIVNATGKTMNDFAQIEDFWYRTYAEVAITGKPMRFENNAENLHRYYDVYAFKVGGKDERKVGVLFTDITDRKNTEDAIRKSEKQFKDITEAIPQLVWVCNSQGEVTYFNDKWYQFTGSGPEESLGHGWSNLLHPDDVPRTLAHWHHAQESATTYAIEYRLKAADGGYRWVFSSGVPMKDDKGNIETWFGTCTDIHERKKTEEALQESEAQFAFAIDATELGVWDYNPTTNKLRANTRLKEWFGLQQHEEVDLEIALAVIDESDRQRVNDAIAKTLTFDGGDYDIEYTIINSKTGQRRTVRAKGKTSFDENKVPYRFNGTLQDVTVQSENRKRVEKSESRFRALVNATSDVVYSMSADWGEMHNLEGRGFLTDTGAPIQEWVDKYIHPIDRENVKAAVSESISSRSIFELEHRVVNADGVLGWTFSRAVPIFDDQQNIVEWFGAATDVTERKNAERALQNSEENLRNLLLQSPVGICLIDAKTLVSEIVNDKFVEISGKPYGSIMGKHYWETFAEAAPYYEEALQRVVDTGEPFYANEVEMMLIRHGREEIVYVTFVYEPMKDVFGLVKKVVIWVLENTPQVHARRRIEESENRYRILSETLEQQVAERTKELQRSNDDLQQFAHVASHDLKEPVRKIKIFTARLEDHFSGQLDESAKRFFERVHVATNRMFTMIDGVLAYSTINEGKQEPEMVDLNELIEHIETDVEVALQKAGGRIVSKNLPSIEGAHVLLYQLFYNLINNSLKFTKPGREPIIKISAEVFGNEKAEITLEDNGIGFDDIYANRIFETFSRLNPKDQFEGTGLGLSLCKKIVERHGGTIKAAGVLGEGAKFIITLPMQQNDSTI